MVREESAVSHNDAEHHRCVLRLRHGSPSGIFCKRLHAAHYCSFRISVKRPLYPFPSLFLSTAWLFEAVYLKRRLGH